jgi:hypothetical protein
MVCSCRKRILVANGGEFASVDHKGQAGVLAVWKGRAKNCEAPRAGRDALRS